MTIIPEEEELLLKIIRCPICGEYYSVQTDTTIQCSAYHPPGSCCHCFDRKLTKEEVEQAMNFACQTKFSIGYTVNQEGNEC